MVRESGITPLGTARQGADAINFVIDETLEGVTGQFFDQYRTAPANPLAYDTDVRTALRDWTRAQIRARTA
jgi:hypothetical protein